MRLGDEHAVHHVPLIRPTPASERLALLAEPGEVGGQHRRDDLIWGVTLWARVDERGRSGRSYRYCRAAMDPGTRPTPLPEPLPELTLTELVISVDRLVVGGAALGHEDSGRSPWSVGPFPARLVRIRVFQEATPVGRRRGGGGRRRLRRTG